MVTASAIAAVSELAPGRLAAGFGTGFTARQAMGRPPMRWADLVQYVRQLRGLLQGEVVNVEGASCQLIQSPGFGPQPPIEVPLLLAPIGPKGFAAAREVADGVVLVGEPSVPLEGQWAICAQLITGIVLEAGEGPHSDRVRSALGPAFVTGYPVVWQWNSEAVDQMPGGFDWVARLEGERVAGERHLAVHEGHLVEVTARDLPLLEAAGEAVLQVGWTGDASSFRTRLAHARASGVTEAIVTPAGPDISGELATFARAVQVGVAPPV
jgi:5,10-methylenetetrahydromethanopterin reductase